ncbi:MAG TPA: VTT domain-containing protein [Saprospiraceae bacterium]|nr:VTT domain-containing protein [Saprospiraceae bacterium]HRO08109.1 VTT domain-containing protein [Saprospiraceae bacterium]HRO72734.1 VTT domain-containing protein [Saprospiraceae bacterium]HRP41502.1 VTT domain-containing protein [Saprospiraceae bacterium]
MDFIYFLIELLTNTKEVLFQLFQQYGTYIYVILFLIIFVETGLVLMPFLPGDSLLFTAGLMCAQHTGLDIYILIGLLSLAAILGDNVNYFIGRYASDRMLSVKFKGKQVVKQQWLDDVQHYFEKYGTKTIIIARFMPIVRTITPFASGIGHMKYRTFLPYDIFGGIFWVSSISLAGYFLGLIPVVENNLEKIILGIVFVSVLPMIIKIIQVKLNKKNP